MGSNDNTRGDLAKAAREAMGVDVGQGLIQRVMAGVRYAITGVGPENWFGPMQPLAPQAQDKTEGRMFDYPGGINLRITPREGETSFATLRALADGYDLMRLVIETRKDQIESFDWEIVPKDEDESADKYDDDIRTATDFLTYPDKEHSWPQWLRMQIEDLLVIDAIAVYPRASRGGKMYALELVDPSTLKRVLDIDGRTPMPPDPAYQQVLKGIPASDYSSDDLVYTMRNPRTDRIYGFPPTQQVMMSVNIAMRRQLSLLDYYTAGNVPEALAQVPETWTAQQIADFQLWWDSVLEGNQSARRKMRFIPSLKDIVFPKHEVLKDEMDEWLARIVCFAFSISPTALIKQVNRASGEQMADTAKSEGLMPLLRFIETHMDRLLQRHMGFTALRFHFKIVNRVNPEQQATIHKTYVDAEVMTTDEVREELGMDAMTPAQREAAWPTPVPQGFNPDGTPLLPKGAKGAAVPVPAAPGAGPKAAEPTPAEKMLATALSMLDPQALRKVAESLAPHVVELRPEINVEVGDTNVHVPVARSSGDAGSGRI